MAAEKLKKTFRSNVKTKSGPFGNIVNLFDNLFLKSQFSLLHKILNFCPRTNEYNKQNINKDLVKFTVMLNLRHALDQLRIMQMNLYLKAIAITYQINYPDLLKPL